MIRSTLPLVALTAVLAPAATAQQWRMTHLNTIDLAPATVSSSHAYIGPDATAIAWNGTYLYAAGYNLGATATETAIIKIENPLTGTPLFSFRRGVQPSATGSGYTGMDITPTTLVAAYDDGTVHAAGITAWEAINGFSLWAAAGQGSSSVACDPGPGASGSPLGSGAAWTSLGATGRALNDVVTGAVIWDTATGMPLDGAGTGNFFRDLDFDQVTGDVWVREGNNLIKLTRTGDNTVGAATLVVDEPEADFVIGQNVEFMNHSWADVIIYNDRQLTTTAQPFSNVIKVVDPAGVVQSVDWGGFMTPRGNGYYDFSYDDQSESLAVLDSMNKRVHIFKVEPGPDILIYCTAKPNSFLCVPSISSTGVPSASQTSGFVVSSDNIRNNKNGIMFYGFTGPDNVPFAGGTLCVMTPIKRTGVVFSGGTPPPPGGMNDCSGVFTLDVNAFAAGLAGGNPDPQLLVAGTRVNVQFWGRDPGFPPPQNFVLSDGLEYTVLP